MYLSNIMWLLKHLFFNWRVISLQNFVVFCQTPTWISQRYTDAPSLLKLALESPSPPHPSRLIQSPCLSFLSHAAIPIGSVFYICWWKFPCSSLHTAHPLLPSAHVHKSILRLHCCPANKFISHLSRFHIYALAYNIYLSLSDLLHSV